MEGKVPSLFSPSKKPPTIKSLKEGEGRGVAAGEGEKKAGLFNEEKTTTHERRLRKRRREKKESNQRAATAAEKRHGARRWVGLIV